MDCSPRFIVGGGSGAAAVALAVEALVEQIFDAEIAARIVSNLNVNYYHFQVKAFQLFLKIIGSGLITVEAG